MCLWNPNDSTDTEDLWNNSEENSDLTEQSVTSLTIVCVWVYVREQEEGKYSNQLNETIVCVSLAPFQKSHLHPTNTDTHTNTHTNSNNVPNLTGHHLLLLWLDFFTIIIFFVCVKPCKVGDTPESAVKTTASVSWAATETYWTTRDTDAVHLLHNLLKFYWN